MVDWNHVISGRIKASDCKLIELPCPQEQNSISFFPICFRSIGRFGLFFWKYFDFTLGDKQCNFPKMYKLTFISPLCNIKSYKINICTHRTFLPRRSFTVISIIACNFKKNITSIQPILFQSMYKALNVSKSPGWIYFSKWSLYLLERETFHLKIARRSEIQVKFFDLIHSQNMIRRSVKRIGSKSI